MNFLRIKQAQCALADGRLEEAHQLLQHESLRSHREGQRLTTKLIRALVERGRQHLEADRLSEALADCTRAGQLAANDQQVSELRRQVLEQMHQQRRRSFDRAQLLDNARRHARDGFLTQGAAMLHGLDDDSGHVAQAQREFELHKTRTEAAIERATTAIDCQDWTAAGHYLAQARQLRPFDPRVQSLLGQLAIQVVTQARQAVDNGRVDTAKVLLQAIAPAAGDRMEVSELRDAIGQINEASSALHDGDVRAAGRQLCRVKLLLPGAKWIDEAIELADRIAASREALEVGPLGLVHGVKVGPGTAIAYHGEPEIPLSKGTVVLPRQFIIQADGQSAALVVRDDSVSLGPISSNQRPDVGLMADPSAPVLTIRRAQEDYFVSSEQPVNVNGKATREQLLNDGDKIELSPRCRFRFRLPHAASTSAVLELTGTRLPRGDLRRIVLLDRQLVVGSANTCHLRADTEGQPLILHLRDGQLCCPQADGSTTLNMNQSTTLGDVTLRLTEA
ncbi:MAG: hypothetical protein IT445_14650 [Phycisphaeraceae bacterium]|nr:hypothetical protein [Phycisphaeraceae bacterium]